VNDDDEIILVLLKGKIMRIKVKDIRIIGRNTNGVRIVNLKEEDKVVKLEKIARTEEEN